MAEASFRHLFSGIFLSHRRLVSSQNGGVVRAPVKNIMRFGVLFPLIICGNTAWIERERKIRAITSVRIKNGVSNLLLIFVSLNKKPLPERKRSHGWMMKIWLRIIIAEPSRESGGSWRCFSFTFRRKLWSHESTAISLRNYRFCSELWQVYRSPGYYVELNVSDARIYCLIRMRIWINKWYNRQW